MSNIMATALNILSSRAFSESELHQRLIKEFACLANVDQEVDATIERLKDLHLINDMHIAEHLALRFSHKGNRYIKEILAQKGIKKELIDEMMTSLDPEEQRAFIEAKKKLRFLKLDKNEQAKLFRFLLGRGFATDSIQQALAMIKEEYLTHSLT